MLVQYFSSPSHFVGPSRVGFMVKLKVGSILMGLCSLVVSEYGMFENSLRGEIRVWEMVGFGL